MHVSTLPPDRLAEAAELVAACQMDPGSHVAYLSSVADVIATELAGLEPAGLGDALAALDPAGRVVGLLAAEHDRQPPRVWWHGPFVASAVDRDGVADRLYLAACARLPAHVRQQELAGDDRGRWLAAFARRHGFVGEEASALLRRMLDPPPDDAAVAIDLVVHPPTAAERRTAAALHDRLFPGTHATGRDAVRAGPDRLVLVAVADGALVGYLAAEVQADRSGYIDHLGVAEAARGNAVGARLVTTACRTLHETHGVRRAHLTVRADNAVARGLYARLGFTEERVLRPWRRGFSLA